MQCSSVPVLIRVACCIQGLPVPCFGWRVLPRSPAGAVAVNKGHHQLAGGIIGEVQAETCVIFDMVNEDPQQMILD